jgi:exopolyphosphatase/guanosine-5'-triphosphate,3'-diphosphate pyrophosphatase
MSQRNYPLAVTHGYVIPATDAADFAGLVERANTETLISIDAVSAARRPLLAYGAVVLDEIIRRAWPREVMISTTGVREGLLYEMLDMEQRRQDPLLVAAAQFNRLFARAPGHAGNTRRRGFEVHARRETRKNAGSPCRLPLADVNWRAHPDHRHEESMNIVENAAFLGVDHRPFVPRARGIYRYHRLDADVGLVTALVSRGCSTGRVFSPPRPVAAPADVIAGAMSGVHAANAPDFALKTH